MADQIQELEERLTAAAAPQEKVLALNALADYWLDKDPQRSHDLSQTAFNFSHTEPQSDDHLQVVLNLSRACQRLGDLNRALGYALEALPIAHSLASPQQKTAALERLGNIYEHLGNHSESLTYNLEALKLAQESNNQEAHGRILNTIGILYNRTGNYRQELATYQRGLRLSQAAQDDRNEAVLTNNIAMAYFSLQEYDLALESAHQSLNLARAKDVRLIETNVLCTIADIYQAMGDDDQAREYLEAGLAAATSQNFKHLMIYAYLGLGSISTRQGELDVALKHLQTALEMAQEQKSRQEWFQCHQALASVYQKKGEFAQALYHYEQFHTLKETVFDEQSRQTVRNLQVLYQTETARRDAEIYRLKSEELEAEINRRHAAEEALRQRTLELESQNAELDAFAHTVAHDLKSPLSVLLGLTSDADELLPLFSPDDIRQSWQMISHSARRLTNIVDELLLLSSVRGQMVEPRPLAMGKIVSEALERVSHYVHEYGGEISLPNNWLVAWGYGPWVEEVWVNYLSNALKYGGHPAMVELGNERLSDGQIRFWVRDNGAGLSPEQIERLFIPFERLHQVHTKGHGLGLSIVRRIVEKLRGRVGTEAIVGQGSTFYFTLPGATITNDRG
jgi:signal transduction histidine kinase